MVGRRKTPASRVRAVSARAGRGRHRPVALVRGRLCGSTWERRGHRVEFEGAAETQSIVMQNGINEYIGRLVALRTLFESANEEVTRSEFEVFSGRLFENHPGVLRVAWLPKIYSQGACRIRGRGRHRRRVRPIISNRSRMERSSRRHRRAMNIFRFSSRPSRKPRRFTAWTIRPIRDDAAMLERARDNDEVAVAPAHLFQDVKGGTHGVLVGVPVYVKGTSRDHDRRPAAQSRRLRGRDIRSRRSCCNRSARTTAAYSAIAVNAYPPDSGASRPEMAVPDYSSAPQTPESMRPSRTGRTGPARSGSAMPNWQVRAVPTAGGHLASRTTAR